MMARPTFQIVKIPKISETDPKVNELAQKFRAFRLHSLTEDPNAFASTHEAESQRGLDQSISRVANPKAAQFIAVRKAASGTASPRYVDDLESLLRDEWVGMIVLLGPEEGSELSVPSVSLATFPQGDPYQRMTAPSNSSPEARNFEASSVPNELHYHINGTFVSSSARGGGLGKTLMDVAIQKAEEEANKAACPLRLTLSVFSHNTAAKHLYEKAGFQVIKEVQSRSRPDFVAVHMEMKLAAAP